MIVKNSDSRPKILFVGYLNTKVAFGVAALKNKAFLIRLDSFV